MKALNLIKTSFAVRLLRGACDTYYRIERLANNVYRNSVSYSIITSFWKKISIAFRMSFLGRVTESSQGEGKPGILDTCRIAKWILSFHNQGMMRLSNCFIATKIAHSISEIKKDLYRFPIKTCGVIIFTAVLTNIFLYLLTPQSLDIWGWSIRLILLFVAFLSIFCYVGYKELRKTSYFIRYIENYRLICSVDDETCNNSIGKNKIR